MTFKEFKNMLASTAGVKSAQDLELNLQVSAAAFLLATFKILFLDNVMIFVSITAVVFFDWLLGTAKAIKNKQFETRKALKVCYYMPVYFTLATVVLLVEKAHPSAFWLSEAVIMPIIIFQIISILKNASELKLIPGKLLNTILKNIDEYKSSSINSDTDNSK